MENIILINEYNIFESILFGNSFLSWIIAIIVFGAIFGGLKVVKNLFIKRLKTPLAHPAKEGNHAEDFLEVAAKAIGAIRWPFLLAVAAYIAMDILDTHALVQQWMFYIFITLAVVYGIKALVVLIEFGSQKAMDKRGKADDTKLKFLLITVKIFLYIAAVILLLSNFGYDVTSLLAGLGISGLAVALAAQQILGDLFGAFMILFDKPFKVGDLIETGDCKGKVEKVGIRSTRLRDEAGHEIIISNKDMAAARIKNLSS
jgi:small-conductance mechanosensitive channel